MPSDPSLALQQAKSLVTALESFDGSPAQHAQILLRLNRLRAAIEYPYDISARFIENTSTMAALNILIRLGALQALPGVSPDSGDDDDKFISAAELARRANCDVSVILRPLRLLAVQGLVNQGPDPLTFRANALTQAFQPSNLGSNPPMGMSFARTWSMLPSYVATHSPEDIDNLLKTPWAYAHGVEGKSFYEGLDGDAVLRKAFDVTMRVMAENTQFRGIFPFKKVKEDVIGKEGVKERAFIVDVGGGKGQALRVIAEECGGFGGMRGVLQDLESVVKVVERDRLPEEVETMVYDAFTEQPVKRKLTPSNTLPNDTTSAISMPFIVFSGHPNPN